MGSASPSPFRYSTVRHVRRLKPGPFSKSRDYIDALAEEFYHSCVYCLMPDVFGGTFEVEHYRPESKFKDLRSEYSNLFYACRACNGRKGKKWFEPEPDGAYIVNPCQDAMGEHLWFEAKRAKPRSKAGKLTEETLRLNDPNSVKFRENVDLVIAEAWTKLVGLRKRRPKVVKAINAEKDAVRKRHLETALEALDGDVEKRVALLRQALGRQGHKV